MNEEIKIAQDEVKKYALIESLEISEAGEMIIKEIKGDALNAIEKIKSLYKTAPEIELRTWCAVLDSRLSLLSKFKNNPKNKKIASEELDELLKNE